MTDTPPHHIAAILPCSDLEASTAFYERLGLSVVSDYGTYRLLEDGKGWQLHLTNESGPTWPERVRDAILGPVKAATHKPWGMYEFALSDPDETLVRVGWPSKLIG